MLSENKNVFLGVVFSYVALVVSMLGSFFVTPVLLNYIGDDNYGLLSFCTSITSWLSLISAALGSSFVFFANKCVKERGNDSRANTLFFKLLTIVGCAMVIITLSSVAVMKLTGAKIGNYNPEQNDILLLLFLISGLNVSVTVFLSIFFQYNNYKKSFAFTRGTQIVLSIAAHIANMILAINTRSIIYIAIVSMCSALLNGISNLVYAVKAKKMLFENAKIKDNKSEISSIIKYSSIILISVIIDNMDVNLDKTILGLLVDAESVAMYQLSITFSHHLLVLSWTFIEVMRPTIFALYRNDRISEANELFIKISKMQMIVVLLIVGGYFACGYHFVSLWIGAKRIEVYYYSAVAFLFSIIPLTKSASNEAHRARNTHKIPTLFSVIAFVVNFIVSLTLLFVFERQYAVWACIIGTIIPKIIFGSIILPIYDKKKIGLPIGEYYRNVLKFIVFMVVAAAPALFAALKLENYDIHIIFKVLIEGCVFVAIYSAEILIFERNSLKSMIETFFKRKKNSDIVE